MSFQRHVLLAIAAILWGLLASPLCSISSAAERARTSPPVGAERETTAATLDDAAALLAEAVAARETFATLSEADVALAKGGLERSAAELDRYLSARGENGAAWKKFILWDELQAQLAPGADVDPAKLDRVLARFRTGFEGLGLDEFRTVADALADYVDTLRAIANPNARADYEARLDELAVTLKAIQADITSDAAFVQLGTTLDELARQRQALSLVTKIRERFSQPNLFLVASADFINAAASRPIDSTEPVTDVILGTYITGTGRTIGKADIKLVPDPDRAVFETVVSATNYSKTVGRNGPARIYSRGQTRLLGRLRLYVDAIGMVRAEKARVDATTRSTTTGIGSSKGGLLGRIVRRVAARRVPKQKALGERIAAQHAERDFAARLNAEAAAAVARANASILARVRLPLLYRGEYPRLVKMNTTANTLNMALMHDSVVRLAAPTPPPETTRQAEVSLRVHESLMNNYAKGLLAGRTLDKAEVEDLAAELLDEVPTQLAEEEGGTPWSITFARTPVTVRLDNQQVGITIRGDRFISGERAIEAMNITARYQLDLTGPVAKMIREPEIEVFPPYFVPGQGRTLPLRLTSIRTLLKRRFGNLFPEEVELADLDLASPWDKISPIALAEIGSDNGWLVLGWERAKSAASRVASRQENQ